MANKRLVLLFALLAFGRSVSVLAQATTVTPGLTLGQTLDQLISPTGSPAAASAMGLAVSLEVTSAPLGTSSGGFVFKLDPSTGLQARTATTFGPSFAERALTTGEGKVSAAVSVKSATYDRLGERSLENMRLGFTTAATPEFTRSGLASLVLSSTTLVMSGMVGVTDTLDIGLAVPMVKVELNGLSWVENARGDVLLRATGAGTSSGLGDVAGTLKYRFMTFGTGTPDPGGLAVLGTVHLPTGDSENFRGLGVTRTLVSLIASFGRGRLRPHFNAGYERWSDGIQVVTDFNRNTTLTARDQLQYAAGAEFEAAPKLTLLIDFLGRHIRHAGEVGERVETATANPQGITSFGSAVALPQGIRKLELVPGLKLNVKGTMLLSLNVITSLVDNGLHARATPVAAVDLTF